MDCYEYNKHYVSKMFLMHIRKSHTLKTQLPRQITSVEYTKATVSRISRPPSETFKTFNFRANL
jgi:hypothetical protein